MRISERMVFDRTMPRAIAAIGGREQIGRQHFLMKWGELRFGPGFALALILFRDHYALHVHTLFCNLYLRLPMLQRWHYEPFEILESWGVSECDGALHFNWGRHTWIVRFPWCDWIQTAHDVRLVDGSWTPYVGIWEDKPHDQRHVEQYPYHYMLKSGIVQTVTAVVHVERRRRQLRWLRWTPFGHTTHAISIDFSSEVGEQTGSWKGGTVGCGYELRPGETAYACLKRMEQERRFL